jgi:hypothetical protein
MYESSWLTSCKYTKYALLVGMALGRSRVWTRVLRMLLMHLTCRLIMRAKMKCVQHCQQATERSAHVRQSVHALGQVPRQVHGVAVCKLQLPASYQSSCSSH